MSVEEKLIKISVPGERFWGAILPDGRVEVRKYPLQEGIQFRDIVDIDDSGNILRVVDRKFKFSASVNYDKLVEEIGIDAAWAEVCKMESEEVSVEGWAKGFCSISTSTPLEELEFPKGVTYEPTEPIFYVKDTRLGGDFL